MAKVKIEPVAAPLQITLTLNEDEARVLIAILQRDTTTPFRLLADDARRLKSSIYHTLTRGCVWNKETQALNRYCGSSPSLSLEDLREVLTLEQAEVTQ